MEDYYPENNYGKWHLSTLALSRVALATLKICLILMAGSGSLFLTLYSIISNSSSNPGEVFILARLNFVTFQFFGTCALVAVVTAIIYAIAKFNVRKIDEDTAWACVRGKHLVLPLALILCGTIYPAYDWYRILDRDEIRVSKHVRVFVCRSVFHTRNLHKDYILPSHIENMNCPKPNKS